MGLEARRATLLALLTLRLCHGAHGEAITVITTGQQLADAVAANAAGTQDIHVHLAASYVDVRNATFVSAPPGSQPIPPTTTLTIQPGNVSFAVLDLGMRAGLTTPFFGPGKTQLTDLVLMNACQLELIKANGPPVLSSLTLALLSVSRTEQRQRYINVVNYVPMTDIRTTLYAAMMQVVAFPQVQSLTSWFFSDVAHAFAVSGPVTSHQYNVVSLSLGIMKVVNYTLKSLHTPDDPLLQSWRDQGLLMPPRFCLNGSLVPPDVNSAGMDVRSGPVWIVSTPEEVVQGLTGAAALSQSLEPDPRWGTWTPPMVYVAQSVRLDQLVAPVTVRRMLLIMGPRNDVPELAVSAVLDWSGKRGAVVLLPGAQLLVQGLTMTGLAPAPSTISSQLPSVFPLQFVSSSPAATTTTTTVTAPYVWLHNVTLVLPTPEYLAVLSLTLSAATLTRRTDSTVLSCLAQDPTTPLLASQLRPHISTLLPDTWDPGYQWLSLAQLTGSTMNATHLRLAPDSPLPATFLSDCRLMQPDGRHATPAYVWALLAVFATTTVLLASLLAVMLFRRRPHKRGSGPHSLTAAPDIRSARRSTNAMLKARPPTSSFGQDTSSAMGDCIQVHVQGEEGKCRSRSAKRGRRQAGERNAAHSSGSQVAGVVGAAENALASGLGVPSLDVVGARGITTGAGVGRRPRSVGVSAKPSTNTEASHPPDCVEVEPCAVRGEPGGGSPGQDTLRGGCPGQDTLRGGCSSAGGAPNAKPDVFLTFPSSVVCAAAAVADDALSAGATCSLPLPLCLDSLSAAPTAPSVATASPAASTDLSSSQIASCPLERVRTLAAQFSRAGDSGDKVIIKRVIGQGAWGTVYAGLWRGLPVALKTMVFAGDELENGLMAVGVVGGGATPCERRVTRAIMEAAIAASVGHKHLVATYHYDFVKLNTHHHNEEGSLKIVEELSPSYEVLEAEGLGHTARPHKPSQQQDYKMYLVQELCSSALDGALATRAMFHLNSELTDQLAVYHILLHMATGLAYLHEKGIIHGDLKPANVMLKADKTSAIGVIAKLGDFGLSTRISPVATHVSNYTAGSPFYVAPEVVTHHRTSPASDIFSFGICAWQMYTGLAPYLIDGNRATVRNPAFPGYLQPNVPPPLFEELVNRCLTQEPAQRPSIGVVIQVLQVLIASAQQPPAIP